jgi:Flp pilus assembly protein TadB
MDEDHIPLPSKDDDDLAPGVQIAGLVNDVRSLAEAEWKYARARLTYSGGVVRKAGIFAILAILALSAAAVALVLGILLIIASYFGPWVATIAVVLAFGLAAYFFAIAARKTARSLSFTEEDDDVG